MTNLERWRFYLKDRPSPDLWIDLGWYYCVAAALQRRVWYGNLAADPLFPNLYLILIGPASTGKNLVLMPAARLLKHWTKNPAEQGSDETPDSKLERLIPMGPDTVTFEKLIERLSTMRRFTYHDKDGKERVYGHSSMAFVLEELNALFQRHNDKVPKLMLKAYDCGDYDYEIKNGASNYVKRICMNFIAGATPAILKEAEQYNIFADGFTSRSIWSFQYEPRHYNFDIGRIGDEQLVAFNELTQWIKRLTGVFGELTYGAGVMDFLQEWHSTTNRKAMRESHPKLQGYFGRKRVHVPKFAAAIHYSEALTPEIPLSAFEKALEILAKVEENMFLGFSASGRNTLHPISRDILRFIKSKPEGASAAELLANFQAEVTLDEIETVAKTLIFGEEIRMHNGRYCAY